MEKLLVMNAAAALTQAACSTAGANLPVDPNLQDNAVRAKNLHVWETFRVFYHALAKALPDNASWPAPTIEGGRLLPNLLGTLMPLFNSPQVQQLLQTLLAALPKVPPAVPGPLPNPGDSNP